MPARGLIALLTLAFAAAALPIVDAGGLQRAASSWSSMISLPRYSAPFSHSSAPAPPRQHRRRAQSNALHSLAALSLGRDHAELDAITTLINQIIAELAAQESDDSTLIAGKQTNLTALETSSLAANATHDQSVQALAAATESLDDKRRQLEAAQNDELENAALCATELQYVTKMEEALSGLHGVGADSALLQLSQRLDVENLLGRPYADQSTAVQDGIDRLREKIDAKTHAYAATVRAREDARADADASRLAAAETELRDQLRRREAGVRVDAGRAELAEARRVAAASHAGAEEVRAVLSELSAKLAELRAEPETNLATGAGGVAGGAAEAIADLLNELENKIDGEAAAQSAAKQAKYDAWVALRTTLSEASEDASVSSATLSEVGGHVDVAEVKLEAARRAQEDEGAAQEKERSFLSQLRALLAGLAGEQQWVATPAAAPTQRGALLALGLGAQRGHAAFTAQFDTLLAQMESAMRAEASLLQQKLELAQRNLDALRATYSERAEEAGAATLSHAHATSAAEEAEAAYETARTALAAADARRAREKAHIEQLRAIVARLRAQV